MIKITHPLRSQKKPKKKKGETQNKEINKKKKLYSKDYKTYWQMPLKAASVSEAKLRP